MLYKEKKQPFSPDLFQNPAAAYRGAPFWAWNSRMTRENIDRSLDALKDMGMGGAHIHCRTGMANTYLGQEFMDLVSYTNKELKNLDMLTWLYDEDRWPSGAAGGYVTKEHKYRIRFLVFSPVKLEGKTNYASNLSSSGQAVRSDERVFLNRYGVTLKNGSLEAYRCIDRGAVLEADEQEWFAYLEVSGDNPWFNNQAYLNTLDPEAVQRFVEVTHEAYARTLGKEFGESVFAIFTDEPQFSHKTQLRFADERTEVTIPFTDDLEASFEKEYGHSLMEHLPELFWELPGGEVSLIRYEYHDHIAERFASAFADTVGSWCKSNHIMLTGHMMEEPTLQSQTAALGDAMRSFRSFDLPGIDMLCDRVELTTAKQAQSAVHQYNCPGVLSELYGGTNWDFDFKGHKLEGDWQAALGVTVRVPHLTWTSMEGEAKRDFPASIGFQSPWYQEYSYIENYFGRLNVALTRGKPDVRIGVIHPVESYWLYWGTEEQTGAVRGQMDEQFQSLADYLLYGLLDFDFLCESLLLEQTENRESKKGKLQVGAMEYDVVLVPNCETLRSSTLDLLECYTERGGKVVFAGKIPYLEGAVRSERPGKLASRCDCVSFERETILHALEPYRILDIRSDSGSRSNNLIYQMREEPDKKWLFLSHVRKMKNADIPQAEHLKIIIRGHWNVTEYDALDGKILPCACEYENETTILHRTMYEQDSLLLSLEKPSFCPEQEACEQKSENTGYILERQITAESHVGVELSEPNVMILDQAEYRFDKGVWNEKEEILRIDNAFRNQLGYPLRMEAFAQPWVKNEQNTAEHKLTLRIKIQSETEISDVWLGMEDPEDVQIMWNDAEGQITGEWYVDPCIQKVFLGRLRKGSNELLVTIPFYAKRNVEAMYLLGNFGVRQEGPVAFITEPVRTLAFGDTVTQGLPFYGGNLTYKIPFDVDRLQEVRLKVTKFRAPVLKVKVDGRDCGYIAFSPYELSLGKLESGRHMVEITCFGNRINTFGTLHNCDEQTEWYGPNAWRTEGDSWSYEYQLRKTGILKSPILSGC